MSYTEIEYEVDGHVGVITLNRPEAHNALTWTTYSELEDAVRSTEARCLVITGAGRSFCSGDDVKQLMSTFADREPDTTRVPRLTPAAEALLYSDVPLVAAVNGAAVGWGMELALMCDLRVASSAARFGELFVKRGLVTDVPGIGRLAQLVGREKAAEMVFTGEIIDAVEAERIGLVGRVVEPDQLMDVALERAHAIASNPPLAIARMKAAMRDTLDPDWRSLGEWVSRNLGELFKTEDHKEGVASFLEKRPPVFQGR
jgi:enoyl-CoA hydratase/carnithine racemase